MVQPSYSQQPYPDALRSEGLPLGHLGLSSEVHRARGKLPLGLLFPWAAAVTRGLELKEPVGGSVSPTQQWSAHPELGQE